MALAKWVLIAALLAFAVGLFTSWSGCCGHSTPTTPITTPTNEPTPQPTPTAAKNRAPVVNLTLDKTEGPVPFTPVYSYRCYDPDNNLVSCELKMDGRTYAKGTNQSTLLPNGYEKPAFFWNATRTRGRHTLEISAVDAAGLKASKAVNFTVLIGAPITKPGWYKCNKWQDNPPCDTMLAGYCDKFVPTNLAVREAVAQAISKHPGQFSVNQLLDIYDWVHDNVFYHNVPLDMYPPYPPNETLSTKSGDCKNQAVLIASMVEAVGGSARILLVPDCTHAFAEVYLGRESDLANLNDAIDAHYSLGGQNMNWHITTSENNGTEYWYIFDTAGGRFPGNTIASCLNASSTFEIRDCNRGFDELNAPVSEGTAYGPSVKFNDTRVLSRGGGYNYWLNVSVIPNPYKWCHYALAVRSLSPTPLDWYLTDATGYENSQAHRTFSYYKGEAQVQQGNYEFDWSEQSTFYVIIDNSNKASSITINIQLVETCYKS